MTTGVSVESYGDVTSRAWRGRTARRALLIAGIVAVGVYVVADLLSGLLYEGYSFADQAISELSAYGSPVRPLILTFFTVYGLLLIAFSVGMWRAGARRRALRWAAVFLLASTLVGMILHPFFPMSSRGMETGLNDTMHQVLTGVWGLFVLPAVVFAAVAYRGWWRLYSIGSLLIMMVFAWLATTAMQGLADNLSTPRGGLYERINAYTFLAWLAVLAVTLMRRSLNEREPEMDGTGKDTPSKEPAIVASG